MRVLVIEDNPKLAALLARGFGEEGWQVELAHDLAGGRARIEAEVYDAIVLDRMLPGGDGLNLLRSLRRAGDGTPVLVLTARDEVDDRVEGLDAGADDYLSKPFAYDELIARLHALVRRSRGVASNALVIGDLEVDSRAKIARRAGVLLDLSAREFAVLECLAQHHGRVVSRERLLDHVYGHAPETASNVIDVFIAHLRRKVDGVGVGKLIHTRRGLGYVLEVRA